MNLRAIEETDWLAIGSVQEACYPPVAREHIDSLRCHWRLSPETCFVLGDESGIAGYFLSHPWPRRVLPPLNKLYTTLPELSDSLFIHDLAILSQSRGKGLAGLAVRSLLETADAKRLGHCSLISVQGTQAFWERHGFLAVPEVTRAFQEEFDRFYPGGGCTYMERTDN